MEDNNLTPRQIQAITTRTKIYKTAQKLISEYGFENVKISEICKKSEVSNGAFYHHFQSKYDIIVESFKEGDRYIESQLNDFLKENSSSEERLIELIRLEMNYAKKIGVDLVKQMFKNELQVKQKFLTSEDHLFNSFITNIVIAGQRENEIRSDMTANEISNYIIRFTRGIIYDWCLNEGNFDIVDFSTESFKHFIKIFV
ncbi:transcriptional regulator, TetR family [Dethiosulfatibacter aminovorans DSM 17477]|uniref:Transcriptional regulator, TetR family n=1 Tax=Dethiosulfatibacter aminovorans DSM 17477 TaxID=1121476 RepID=A0A1M6NEF6_9FIRM|nr:TetR/AcrR family transcriptional regulator [Dethiosulfatibacter aminovorans]SHJ94033.1 transcriptional regulator, TetR family [Dethiosulfatibacter aminovorans DSM 17477]